MPRKTLIVQSYRREDVPGWIARCLDSVRGWAELKRYDYRLTGDEAFELCGEEYLAQVSRADVRAITNLCRLELVRNAFAEGYQRAVWLDADMFVFDPANFDVRGADRYAFARETWIGVRNGRLAATSSINNSAFVCNGPQPDLDFLIDAIRHIARHRRIFSNYQVGGDLIKGLARSMAFQALPNVGMFSPITVTALADGDESVLRAQASFHGTPVRAANLCATERYSNTPDQPVTLRAMDRLEETRGRVLNDWLDEGPSPDMLHFSETRYLDEAAV